MNVEDSLNDLGGLRFEMMRAHAMRDVEDSSLREAIEALAGEDAEALEKLWLAVQRKPWA